MLWLHEKADGSRLSRCFFDEAIALQSFDHFVNRRSGDPEVLLEISFSRRPAVNLRIIVNEGEVLALFGGKFRSNGWIEFRRGLDAYLKVVITGAFEFAGIEDVEMSTQNATDRLSYCGEKVVAQLYPVPAAGGVIRDPDIRAALKGEDPQTAIFVVNTYRFGTKG